MRRRELGRTGRRLGVIGLGTCQLRLVPEEQALFTLRRAFELGVNVVHTAPDYEGAEDLVAHAVRESGREIHVLSQGYGDVAHFEYVFESTCRRLERRRLELYGIACVEDRVALGENVFGRGGMVEFLQAKQREGRLGGLFASTHGGPDYVARLLGSGVATPDELPAATVRAALQAAVVSRDVPAVLEAGQPGLCRIYLENVGATTWGVPDARPDHPGVALSVTSGERTRRLAPLRQEVERGARAHFVFALRAPLEAGSHALCFALVCGELTPTVLFSSTLCVPERGTPGSRR